MKNRLLAVFQPVFTRLKLPLPRVVMLVELAGVGLLVYGVYGWSPAAAYVVGGVGLVLEAYALEHR